jgi:hypothetical protein
MSEAHGATLVLEATIPPLMADVRRGPDLAYERGRVGRLLPTVPPRDPGEPGEPTLPVELDADFELLEELPRGGMARVWRATDKASGEQRVVRMAAVPVVEGYVGLDLLRELGDGSADQRCLVRQYATLVRASDNTLWQVLEHCPAGSLSEQAGAATEPGDPRDGVVGRVARDVTEALGVLHRSGLAHTDVKPDNILAHADGTFVLADLDTCVRLAAPRRPSPQRSGHRTPGYTAPETEYCRESDFFQLGLTLLHLATGEPRPSESWASVDYSALPPALVTLLSGLLERDPELRWGAAHVARWLAGESPAVTSPLVGRVRAEAGRFTLQYASAFFHDPVALGEQLSGDWSAARRAVRSVSKDRPWLLELAGQLEGVPALDAAASVRQLYDGLVESASDAELDAVIANLIRLLDPHGVPRYAVDGSAPVVLSAAGLRAFADDVLRDGIDGSASGATRVVAGLLRAEILHPLSQMAGAHPGLWHVPEYCERAFAEYARIVVASAAGKEAAIAEVLSRMSDVTVAGADSYTDMIKDRAREPWECFAASLGGPSADLDEEERRSADEHARVVRALIFAYAVSPEGVDALRAQVRLGLASTAMGQGWYAAVAGSDLAGSRREGGVR